LYCLLVIFVSGHKTDDDDDDDDDDYYYYVLREITVRFDMTKVIDGRNDLPYGIANVILTSKLNKSNEIFAYGMALHH